jgi:endogenous inhibitor of DNA gyrase (YacG/DUF329 family)
MPDPKNTEPARRCAICGKPASPKFTPFCSGRCADVDLNRWLSGSYVIPTSEAPDDEEESRPAPSSKHEE